MRSACHRLLGKQWFHHQHATSSAPAGPLNKSGISRYALACYSSHGPHTCRMLYTSQCVQTVSAEELQDKQVYYGGPCGRGTANILHCCSEIEGATQIIEVRMLALSAYLLALVSYSKLLVLFCQLIGCCISMQNMLPARLLGAGLLFLLVEVCMHFQEHHADSSDIRQRTYCE